MVVVYFATQEGRVRRRFFVAAICGDEWNPWLCEEGGRFKSLSQFLRKEKESAVQASDRHFAFCGLALYLKADIIEACECLRPWYGKPHSEDDSDCESCEA